MDLQILDNHHPIWQLVYMRHLANVQSGPLASATPVIAHLNLTTNGTQNWLMHSNPRCHSVRVSLPLCPPPSVIHFSIHRTGRVIKDGITVRRCPDEIDPNGWTTKNAVPRLWFVALWRATSRLCILHSSGRHLNVFLKTVFAWWDYSLLSDLSG